MKYKAVIYDLDGTLLYTLDDLRNSVNYALDKFGHPLRTLDEIRFFIGNGVAVLMRRSAPAYCSDEEVAEMLDVFRTHYLEHMYDNTRAYDGILDMMQDIHNEGLLSAIVSNKLDPAVKELDRLFFKGLTTTAIGAPPGAKKPDPTSVFMCLDELGVKPSEAIYVGDTDVDLETAHNAGLKCVGVSWGFRGRKFLEDISCDYIIDEPRELLPLLKKII